MSTNKYLKDYLNGESDDTTVFEGFHNRGRKRQKLRAEDPSDRKETRRPKSRLRRTTQKDDMANTAH